MRTTLFCSLLSVCLTASVVAADSKPIPIILDTDIGTDVDDAFALGLILASPELELRAVTTSGGQTEDRAWIVCRFSRSAARPGFRSLPGRSRRRSRRSTIRFSTAAIRLRYSIGR